MTYKVDLRKKEYRYRWNGKEGNYDLPDCLALRDDEVGDSGEIIFTNGAYVLKTDKGGSQVLKKKELDELMYINENYKKNGLEKPILKKTIKVRDDRWAMNYDPDWFEYRLFEFI